jgi:hypothetical protein
MSRVTAKRFAAIVAAVSIPLTTWASLSCFQRAIDNGVCGTPQSYPSCGLSRVTSCVKVVCNVHAWSCGKGDQLASCEPFPSTATCAKYVGYLAACDLGPYGTGFGCSSPVFVGTTPPVPCQSIVMLECK